MKPEIVVDSKLDIGENPLWHPFEKRLYWVDIHRNWRIDTSQSGSIFRYNPVTGDHEEIYKG